MSGLHLPAEKRFHPWRWLILLTFVALVFAFTWFGYRWYTTGEEPPFPFPVASANTQIDESSVSLQKINDYSVPTTHPRYISIPALGVERARVMNVGLGESGELTMPRNINDAAWFNKSATPGSGYGAVIINAHNQGLREDGIFAQLDSLQPDDIITIQRGDGTLFSYSVVENQTLPLDEAINGGFQKMAKSIDPNSEGLSLITTAGTWVPKLQQFDQRVMLRAILNEQPS